MSSELAISVRNLTKHYPVSPSPVGRLIDFVAPNRRHTEVVNALSNVSFDVNRGETLGIVGRNGSGKSTLLGIIVGTLFQTSGEVTKHGVTTGLLEIGSAFDGEFTGLENVELYCAVLGKSRKETATQIDQIIEFSEIGGFISQPVRTYSSGMKLRLAFSTAITVEPDILVIDEALAVGDQIFSQKCYKRLKKIRDDGATILFVSHSAHTITDLCDRAILLDKGELLLEDEPGIVMSEYSRLANESAGGNRNVRGEIQRLGAAERGTHKQRTSIVDLQKPTPAASARQPAASSSRPYKTESRIWGTVRSVKVSTLSGEVVADLKTGEPYQLSVSVQLDSDVDVMEISGEVAITTKDGTCLGGCIVDRVDLPQNGALRGHQLALESRFLCHLNPGAYLISTAINGRSPDTTLKLATLSCKFPIRIIRHGDAPTTGFVDFGFESAIQTQDRRIL